MTHDSSGASTQAPADDPGRLVGLDRPADGAGSSRCPRPARPGRPAAVARRLFARSSAASAITSSRGRRRDRPRRPDDGAAPARRVLRAHRPGRADRLRRVLHDRRLELARTWRGCSPCWPARSATLVPEPLQRLRAAGTSPAHPHDHRNSRGQHPAATSPTTTTCPTTCSRLFLDETHDLLLGAVRPTAEPAPRPGRPGADLGRRPRRRKIERLLDLTGGRAGGPGCSRSAPAGASWRSGPRGAAPGCTASPCRPSSRRWPRERIADGRARPTGSTSSSATTGGVRGRVRRRAVGRDDRGGRPRVLADVLSRPSTTGSCPGGRVGIQAITMPHDRMLATRGTYTWIHKYIFPGGFLPSVELIDEISRRAAGLRDRRTGSRSARTTPRRCGCGTRPSWPPTSRALGFDEVFRRMWHFYLSYSRAGFASGYLDVQQIVLTRPERRWMTLLPAAPLRAGRVAGWPTRPRPFVGGDLPVRLRAWDGSEAGPDDAARWSSCARPAAVRRLLWHPGELGAAQAYVTGELDVPTTTCDRRPCARVRSALAERGLRGGGPAPPRSPGLPRTVLGRGRARPAARAAGLPGAGARAGCTAGPRDRRAISHHYDLSTTSSTRLILDESMAYSCGYWTGSGPGVRPGGRPARQARPGLRQARPRARDDAARRRLRLGLAVAARGPSTTAPGSPA